MNQICVYHRLRVWKITVNKHEGLAVDSGKIRAFQRVSGLADTQCITFTDDCHHTLLIHDCNGAIRYILLMVNN